MKTVVYLVRHGAVVNPKAIIYAREIDVPLSDEGKESVRHLANLILKREKSIKVIYTSPLSRARATAGIIADVCGLTKVRVSEDLNEVDIPGISKHRLKELLLRPDFYNKPFVGLTPEMPEEIIARMARGMSKIVKKNRNGVAVAVSHGDPIGFYIYNLRFPKRSTPTMCKMHSTDYLSKGGAWRLDFNADAKLVSLEKIN